MKPKIFLIFILFFIVACKEKMQRSEREWITISDRIQYYQGKDTFEFKSGRFHYEISKNQLPFKKIMLLNSSLTGYFLQLNAEHTIIGMVSPEYVYSDKIKNLIQENKIQNIGNDQKYDIEKILAYKPDVIFTNYIESFENSYDIIRKNKIQIIFIDEYMEQNPLDKSEIITLIGILIGKEKEAKEIYAEVENNYNHLKVKASQQKNKPVVLSNEMYGNQWFLPGGNTFTANYLKDAGARYILENNDAYTSVPLSFEEVFERAKNAEYWVNVHQHQYKKDLLMLNPNYASMPVYQKGKIYSLSGAVKGKANDVFESGAVRADWLLRDYIQVFHPHLFDNPNFVYIKQLK